MYNEPGPITMASASFIASTIPGVVLQFVGFINTLLIFVTLLVVISAIFSFSSMIVPSSSSTHMCISSSVAGNTFPTIDNTLLLFSIPFARSWFAFSIASRYKSQKQDFPTGKFMSFSISVLSFESAIILFLISSVGLLLILFP